MKQEFRQGRYPLILISFDNDLGYPVPNLKSNVSDISQKYCCL